MSAARARMSSITFRQAPITARPVAYVTRDPPVTWQYGTVSVSTTLDWIRP